MRKLGKGYVYMLEKLCEIAVSTVGIHHISGIVKSDGVYCFIFSDEFGNSVDITPICLNEDGESVNFSSDDWVDVCMDGVPVEVPNEYAPYSILVERELRNTFSSNLITESQINELVDYLYCTDFISLPMRDIYRLCHHFISLVFSCCNRSELYDISVVVEKDVVKSFLGMPLDKKVEVSSSLIAQLNSRVIMIV